MFAPWSQFGDAVSVIEKPGHSAANASASDAVNTSFPGFAWIPSIACGVQTKPFPSPWLRAPCFERPWRYEGNYTHVGSRQVGAHVTYIACYLDPGISSGKSPDCRRGTAAHNVKLSVRITFLNPRINVLDKPPGAIHIRVVIHCTNKSQDRTVVCDPGLKRIRKVLAIDPVYDRLCIGCRNTLMEELPAQPQWSEECGRIPPRFVLHIFLNTLPPGCRRLA